MFAQGGRRLLQAVDEVNDLTHSSQLLVDILVLVQFTDFNVAVYNEELAAALQSSADLPADEQFDVVQKVVVEYFDVLSSTDGSADRSLARVEKFLINELARNLSLSTPYPQQYTSYEYDFDAEFPTRSAAARAHFQCLSYCLHVVFLLFFFC